ncbi:hypothetical protein GEMRC1_010937 [Eukaryota sp. GEM-RC1]
MSFPKSRRSTLLPDDARGPTPKAERRKTLHPPTSSRAIASPRVNQREIQQQLLSMTEEHKEREAKLLSHVKRLRDQTKLLKDENTQLQQQLDQALPDKSSVKPTPPTELQLTATQTDTPEQIDSMMFSNCEEELQMLEEDVARFLSLIRS